MKRLQCVVLTMCFISSAEPVLAADDAISMSASMSTLEEAREYAIENANKYIETSLGFSAFDASYAFYCIADIFDNRTVRQLCTCAASGG